MDVICKAMHCCCALYYLVFLFGVYELIRSMAEQNKCVKLWYNCPLHKVKMLILEAVKMKVKVEIKIFKQDDRC